MEAKDLQLTISSNYIIGSKHPTFIIAEIGQNHQGDLKTAKKLISVAKQCGADCVKFQKTSLNEKFNRKALERPYQNQNSWGQTYGEHKEYLEFSEAEFWELRLYAKELGILFSASAMDLQSLQFLGTMDLPFIKIGSGDSNNLPLIAKAAEMDVPLIISTGMLDLNGVEAIYTTMSKVHKKFVLLHCISSYPTPLEEINLQVINLYKNKFPDVVIGYSGHEIGYQACLGAVALGAKVIERHFTLHKPQKGSDHSCSLDPLELQTLIRDIRSLELALGEPIKTIQKSEEPCMLKLGKTLVTAKKLKKGTTIERDHLKIKVAEPKGLDGSSFESIMGKIIQVDLDEDESILKEHF